MYVYVRKNASGIEFWWASLDGAHGRKPLKLRAGEVDQAGAMRAAFKLQRQLDGAAPQLKLPGVQKPHTIGEAIDRWEAQKEAPTDGGLAWAKKVSRSIRQEVGSELLTSWDGHEGRIRALRYRDELAAAGLSPGTRGDRICILGQVLDYAEVQRWIAARPRMPKRRAEGEKKPRPAQNWIDEASVRVLLNALYSEERLRKSLRKTMGGAQVSDEDVAAYVAARKLWVATCFYAGFHTRDCDEAVGDDFHITAHKHRRWNRKNDADPIPVDSPEPLIAWASETREILGPRWQPLAPVTGGVWGSVAKVLSTQATAAGIAAHVNPRLLRRGCVFELARRGWHREDVKKYMGHSPLSTMVDEVYDWGAPGVHPALVAAGFPVPCPWSEASFRAIAQAEGQVKADAPVHRITGGGKRTLFSMNGGPRAASKVGGR